MGVLAGFFEAEKRELLPAKAANPAKLSNFSNFSSHPAAKTQSESVPRALCAQDGPVRTCATCGAPATLGAGVFPVRGVEGRWFCGRCFPAPKGSA